MLSNHHSHKQLRNVVAERIRTAILDGQYKPGEWMRQERLAQELGVSQMPVREALKELASEGLIEHVPYRGARVVNMSLQDVEDIYTLRAFLESRAAGYAAGEITTEELVELKQLHAEIEKYSAPEDVLKYRELNRRFHELIFTASHRAYLIRTLSSLWAAFPTMLMGNYPRTASQPLMGRDSVDMLEHAAILDALERRDVTAAQKTMKVHVESVMHELLGMISE
jgi:DNA-binding GntR family transcriptional regulator